ncbi:MAG: hypothetical protein FD180_2171 [Planctomycetota bacterium]|nr:MAG: hypothetical protein FD180_2171 [Planctomycetota bacterium]
MKRLLLLCLSLPGVAAAQARADLASDLWFRAAAKDGAWAGFAHVKMENSVLDGKAVWRYFEEGSIETAGSSRGWREEWTLDADLSPLGGLSRERDGAREIEISAALDGRQLVRRAVAPAVERVQAWTRERACWPPGLLPAALLRRYGPWKPGLEMSVSTFSARIEDEALRIGEDAWSVTVKSRGPRTVADAEEDCWTLELVSREGAGGVATLVVDARGLPVEMGGKGWTLKRVRGEREAKDGRDFAWAHGGRRDPFRPALRPLEVRRVGEESVPAVELSETETRALLDDARARLDAMRAAASLPEADRERALAENSRAIRLAAGKLRGSTVPGAAERVAEILESAARLYDPALAAVSTAKALFREIRESFEAGDGASLARIAPLMASLHELGADPDLAGRPEQGTVRTIEEEAAGLDRRAAIRLEGLERLRDHHPNGVMVVRSPKEVEIELGIEVGGVPLTARPRVPVRVASAVALMGEKSYAVGDAIAGVEGCVVKEIRQDSVVVEYRGEAIRMRIGE